MTEHQLLPRRHAPLKVGVAVGIAAGALAAALARLPGSAAVLLGWCAGAAAHLAVSLRLGRGMTGADPAVLRARAVALDEGRWAVLGITLTATLASLAAVAVELAGPRGTPGEAWSAALAAATVLLSWTLVHVVFAHQYAHEHALRGGLDFPGRAPASPDYSEFLYLAFTVGMTAQVSDVTTSSPGMRRLVLAHALVAFVFNAAVVAAAVNLAAGLAG